MKTITTPIPQAVTQYFAAAGRHDAVSAAACFTEDATVHDENRAHVGRPAVQAWLEETGRKYQPVYTIMRTSSRGDEVRMSVAVSGQFPGSPITLDYALRLREGKIAELTIE